MKITMGSNKKGIPKRVNMDTQTDEAQEKRRIRNRLSQRAFRCRQAEYLRDLQLCASSGDRPANETIELLQEENRQLRSHLTEVHSRLSAMAVAMGNLAGSVSKTLNGCCQEDSNDREGAAAASSSKSNVRESQDQLPELEVGGKDLIGNVFKPPGRVSSPYNADAALSSLAMDDLFGGPNGLAPQVPNVWSFEYQMGTQTYDDSLTRCENSSRVLGKYWIQTNSPFSDHIYILHNLLQTKLERITPAIGLNTQRFYKQVLVVLALFNSVTRPDVMKWYAKTRFYHIIDLTAWQILPCAETFNRVHSQYQPTPIQMHHQYPKVIDWIPFPSIRDRLVQCHAANPYIDEIFCEAVSSYVVEALMPDLVMGAPTMVVYIRVTDLIVNTISSPEGNDLSSPLPAPDVASLFSSPECSRAVLKKLNMDHGVSRYKIDPLFFSKYPELYDPNFDIAATGMPLKPDLQPQLSRPRPLDSTTFQIYCSFMEFSAGAPFD